MNSKQSRVTLPFIALILALGSYRANAQNAADSIHVQIPATQEKKWYENISVRGYMQMRYNRLLETNQDLKCEACDKSIGRDGGFFFRRIRIIFSGQISKRISFYLQPDFASAVSSTSLNFGQLRDAYFDIGIDRKNEFRVRIGQSKIPFGFENLQSSQNRMPLDRADALNSSLPNERDLGVFLYWAPESKRKLFADLVREGLKGSGDYGVFGVGAFNGQTMNKPEQNKEMHWAARASYPMKIGNQIIEPGIQGYTGNFVIPKDQISSGTKFKLDRSYKDERVAASLILYPKPFGFQAEYNIGRGPEFNTVTDSIQLRNLTGGYAMLSYLLKVKSHTLVPFTRIQYYEGGKKGEADARSYKVNEWEAGCEWQMARQFELTVMYTISSRRFEDHVLRDNFQKGSLLRVQAQVNF